MNDGLERMWKQPIEAPPSTWLEVPT